MNIQPVKTDAVQVPSKVRPSSAPAAAEPSGKPEIQTNARKEILAEALSREPAIRPEMLDRARELASDPNYPGPNLFAKLAARLIQHAKPGK